MINSKTILVKKNWLKLFLSLFLLASFSYSALSQKITSADRKKLRAKEDMLADYAYFLNTDTLTEDRMISDSFFTRSLLRAQQVKNSVYYPFYSVIGISKLYASATTFLR